MAGSWGLWRENHANLNECANRSPLGNCDRAQYVHSLSWSLCTISFAKGMVVLMSGRRPPYYILGLLALLIITISLVGLYEEFGQSEEEPPTVTETPPVSASAPISVALSPTPSDTEELLPTATAEPTPEHPKGPDVAKREPADDEFFSDAAFVGNSLVDGLRLFSGLTTCEYYASTSMSVLGVSGTNSIVLKDGTKGTIMQGLAQDTYGKVYILLGINEIGLATDVFKSHYKDMMAEMMELQPDAIFYIMGLTPVSYIKSTNSTVYNMDRVLSYNEALYDLAAELDVYYLDLCSVMSDDDGYLPSDVTSDGVHFTAAHYKVWLDYLRTHYV